MLRLADYALIIVAVANSFLRKALSSRGNAVYYAETVYYALNFWISTKFWDFQTLRNDFHRNRWKSL